MPQEANLTELLTGNDPGSVYNLLNSNIIITLQSIQGVANLTDRPPQNDTSALLAVAGSGIFTDFDRKNIDLSSLSSMQLRVTTYVASTSLR